MQRTFAIAVLSVLLSVQQAPAQRNWLGFEKDVFKKASSGDELQYALLKPAAVQPGKTYPLVLSMHGVGGRGKEKWVF